MPAINCLAPLGQTFDSGLPINFQFYVEQQPAVSGGFWTRTCAANDASAMPNFSNDIVVPTGVKTATVSTFAQLTSAIADTTNIVINITGNAFSSSARARIGTEHNVAGQTRYITGSGVPPSLYFDEAYRWTVTGLTFSPSNYPYFSPSGTTPHSNSPIMVIDGEDLMFDSLNRTWGGSTQSFLVIRNRRNKAVKRLTLQKSRLEYTGNAAEFMGVIYHAWLSDFAEADYWSGGQWDANSEDIYVQDNYMYNIGDGLQTHATTLNDPDANRYYSQSNHQNLTIRGNVIGVSKANENAVDLKAGSLNPAKPVRIHDNLFFGYFQSASGAGQSDPGAAIVVHLRHQKDIQIYRNVIYNCNFGMLLKAYESDHYVYDNMFIDCRTTLNIEYYAFNGDNGTHSRLPKIFFDRNVVTGAAETFIDCGYSGNVHGFVEANCNYLPAYSLRIADPASGPSGLSGATVSSVSGSNNVIQPGFSSAGMPGGWATTTNWLSSSQVVDIKAGECGASSQETITAARLAPLASKPSGCTGDFVWAT